MSRFGTGQLHTDLGVPSLSLHGLRHKDAEEQRKEADKTEGPHEPFTTEAFMSAWEDFINAHEKDHLLITAMRSHAPERDGETATFTLPVENELQIDYVREAMPVLRAFLAERLRNCDITLRFRVLEGLQSPQTWNEQEVLADIVRRHPDTAAFIKALKLSLT